MIRQGSSTVIRLATIIKQYEQDFIERYQRHLLPSHYKALSALKTCRSEYNRKFLMKCDKCSNKVLVPHSCGHRHCPHCQNHETTQWLENQLQKRVSADYFLLTFTLPKEYRSLTWRNQRLVFSLLFNCVWAVLKLFCLNDKKLGGIPGAVAVLHTHSRELNFHPHIHIVMPAVTIDKTSRLWRQKSGKYLFNHDALAKVFRAKVLDALTANGLKLPVKYPEKWVVDCKYVGKGDKALLYLGKYLYRGVISEKDILTCENGNVTFRYRSSKTKQYKTKTVSAVQFLWLVLQHILPRGFRRARNYGFLHPNSKALIKIIQWIHRLNPMFAISKLKPRKQMICPCCGATMRITKTRLPSYYALAVSEAP